jgi:hypothetical protein
MELYTLLMFYTIIVIAIIVILIKLGIATLGSVVLSLIIGQIILNLIYPPDNVDESSGLSSTVAFYYMIQYISPVVFGIALIHYAIKDRYVEVRYGPPICTPFF